MTATVEVPAATVDPSADAPALRRADGVELLGAVHGSGYKDGAALVRRGDGQMVQLGPLMYGLLEVIDGRRDRTDLAHALSQRLGRHVRGDHVLRIAAKLARQGLLAGTEHNAPPRRNPLLALRWKVLVSDPKVTERLTAPFTVLFRPWVMWPVLACFAGVFWFVLFHKGVASAAAQAVNQPELLLLVFVLAIASAAFHEFGHAAACRYGGARPGGMGMGLYLVWPAFYTDVTDAYRLPRRARLRVDLGGLYFNAVAAVVTTAVWLGWRIDALLLLVALQVLQMVKQLSPVIRADGYHILSDATGVPDLYAHIGPTLRRLIPWRRRDPSALTGRARLLVTVWVLIVVPVLLSLSVSAVLLLPRLAASAVDSGRHIALAMPQQAEHGHIIAMLASALRLVALSLPVLGSVLVTQKIVRVAVAKARTWSEGHRGRQLAMLAVGGVTVAGIVWAWWPAGQYQPIRAREQGTVGSMVGVISRPAALARAHADAAPLPLAPGKHLALTMIPVGGATKQHPALFVMPGAKSRPPVAIITSSAPAPAPANPPQRAAASATAPVEAAAFPFRLPARTPGGTQALAVNTTNGAVVYDIAYALVTVTGGKPVTQTNSAYAFADCERCTTVAVSFQVVLVVGQSNVIAPVNAAGALNYKCPACVTTAIADQIVVTLKALPSQALAGRLEGDLKQLDALPELGAAGSPAAIASAVANVQHEIDAQLAGSGLQTSAQPSSTQPASPQPAPPESPTTSTSSSPPPTQTTTSASPPSSTTTSQSQSSTTPTPSGSSSDSGTGSNTTTTAPGG